MSIVAVHGPNMWGGTGAAGGGSGPAVDNAGGTVTADMTNGMRFTLVGKGDRAAADYDWTFSDGTAAINNSQSTSVTFATTGAKTITLTVGSSGGTTPPATTYTFAVQADTSPPVQPVDNAAGTVTGDQFNGLLFTLAGKGDRLAADYDWTFSDGTAAINNTKTTTVTFATAGQKTITLTIGSAGGTTPPAGPYTFQVTATTGAVPRSLTAPPSYNPADHTVAEVEQYVTDNPDELQAVYDAEVADKNRSTLITWLEAQFPFDPDNHTVSEVEQYVTDHPDELEVIYEAEIAGKNRVTLVTWLEEFQA